MFSDMFEGAYERALCAERTLREIRQKAHDLYMRMDDMPWYEEIVKDILDLVGGPL